MPTRSETIQLERNISGKLNSVPFFTKGEPEFLTKILRKLPPNPVIFEIGTFRGMSAILMAQQRKDARIITIDSHVGVTGFATLSSSPQLVYSNLQKAGVFPRVTHCVSSSQNFALNERVDLFFIDGDHSYNGVDHDYYKFLPWVKSGGFIVFHDFGTHEGVTRFCNRITSNKKYLRFKSMLVIQKE